MVTCHSWALKILVAEVPSVASDYFKKFLNTGTNLRKENTILGMGSYTKPFHYKKVLGKFCSLNLAKSLSPNPFKRL